MYYYANFDATRDRDRFENDMLHNLTRNTVYNTVMALRSSKGLEIVDYLGGYLLTENSELQVPVLHSDTSVGCRIAHYETLPTNKRCAVQLAMLYLSVDGEFLFFVKM